MNDVPTFLSVERRKAFFTQLIALVESYPELIDRTKREYDADPTSDRWTTGSPELDFNPNNAQMLGGIAIVFSTTDIDGWSDCHLLAPWTQDYALMVGLLNLALE